MAWELDSDRPIFIQIVERIQMEIISGKYSPGDKLPSVRDLAAVAAVNPNTMQKSLTEMNRLLERVGNLSEKYSSKWIDWLPDFSLLVALKWIMLVLILGTAALVGWYGAAAIRGLFL